MSSSQSLLRPETRYAFEEFASYLEVMRERDLPISWRRQMLKDLFNAARAAGAVREESSMLFILIRLLLPTFDEKRASSGIRERTLARLLVAALSLPASSPDARRLVSWTDPLHNSAADFAALASTIMAKRSTRVSTRADLPQDASPGDCIKHARTLLPKDCTATQSSSVKEASIAFVDSKFDELCAQSQTSSTESKQSQDESRRKPQHEVLLWASRALSPTGFKWFLRVLLRRINLGMSIQRILDQFHVSANSLWNFTCSLERVADMLRCRSVVIKPDDMLISTMTPFRPMLAYRPASLSSLPGLLRQFDKPYYCQLKVDGERMVLHYKRSGSSEANQNGVEEYRLFSRNATNWTSSYQGCWLPHLKPIALSPNVTELVLDGEMVAVCSTTGKVQPFGTLRSNITQDTSSSTTVPAMHPKYFVFDIIRINDKVLTKYSAKARLKVMHKVLCETTGWLEILPHVEVSSELEVLNELHSVFMDRGEGIVVKNPAGPYLAGERDSSWIKVKMDYARGMTEPFDVVVVGGYYAEGERMRGMLVAFLCAVRKESESQYYALGKVAGLCMSRLMVVNTRLSSAKRNLPVDNVVIKGAEAPDVYFAPEDSIVIEVIAAELAVNEKYPLGMAFRFPRINRIRDDLGAEECQTVDYVMQIWDKTGGRLIREPTLAVFERQKRAITAVKRKRRHVVSHLSSTLQVDAESPESGLTNESLTNLIFSGISVLLYLPPMEDAIKRLSTLVQRYGGTLLPNFTAAEKALSSNEKVLLVSDYPTNPNVLRLSKLNRFDVLSCDYIEECIKSGKISSPKFLDYVFLSTRTREKLRLEYDMYGDSYTEPVSTIKQMLQILDSPAFVNITACKFSDLKEKIPDLFPLYGRWFSNFQVCVCQKNATNDADTDLSLALLEWHGAKILEPTELANATHLLCDESRVFGQNSLTTEIDASITKISSGWVFRCCQEKKVLPYNSETMQTPKDPLFDEVIAEEAEALEFLSDSVGKKMSPTGDFREYDDCIEFEDTSAHNFGDLHSDSDNETQFLAATDHV